MKRLFTFLALIFLASCATVHDPQRMAEIFTQTCVTAQAADVVFKGVTTIKPELVDAESMAIEAQAIAIVNAICAGPPPDVSNYAATLGTITRAAASISSVLNGAKAADHGS